MTLLIKKTSAPNVVMEVKINDDVGLTIEHLRQKILSDPGCSNVSAVGENEFTFEMGDEGVTYTLVP